MEQLPHGAAARHALVSRLLTKYLAKLHRRTICFKNFLLGNVQVFKREIHNGVMQKCSLKVNKRWFGERKNDMIWVYRKDGCGQGRKAKEE